MYAVKKMNGEVLEKGEYTIRIIRVSRFKAY